MISFAIEKFPPPPFIYHFAFMNNYAFMNIYASMNNLAE